MYSVFARFVATLLRSGTPPGSGTPPAIHIPNGTHSITVHTLRDMGLDPKKVGTVFVPPSVEYIGRGGFAGMPMLTEIVFLTRGVNSPKLVIETEAFSYCRQLQYVGPIPNSVTAIPKRICMECSGLKIVAFAGGCCVTIIGDRAFMGCSSLTFPIPNTVEVIGNEAFRNCKKLDRKLCIPYCTKVIGNYAFACIGQEVEVAVNFETVIENNAFDGTLLSLIDYGNVENLENLENLESINPRFRKPRFRNVLQCATVPHTFPDGKYFHVKYNILQNQHTPVHISDLSIKVCDMRGNSYDVTLSGAPSTFKSIIKSQVDILKSENDSTWQCYIPCSATTVESLTMEAFLDWLQGQSMPRLCLTFIAANDDAAGGGANAEV